MTPVILFALRALNRGRVWRSGAVSLVLFVFDLSAGYSYVPEPKRTSRFETSQHPASA